MTRERALLRPLAGAAILGLLVWRLGAGPFVDALRALDPRYLATTAALAAVTTVCGAWRWVLVARGLGVDLTLRSAVAESYRSQFLNVTLPGGVVGDVRRGVRHGRDTGDIGRGLRAVVWERSAGQVVLWTLTLGALLLLPSPLPSPLRSGATDAGPGVVVAAVVTLAGGVAVVRFGRARQRAQPGGRGAGLPVRLVRGALGDVRAGLLGRHTWPGVVAASVVVVVGHVATFVVAARAVGVTVPALGLAPLALVVLVAMGLPLSVAGWGPREGAAAWVFGAAGLGASAGICTAVVYGVMVLVASLPGAVLLVAAARTPRAGSRSPAERAVGMQGCAHG